MVVRTQEMRRESQTAALMRRVYIPETDHGKYLPLVGRMLYSAIFILSSFQHFSAPMIDHARMQGAPMPGLTVPLSGILILAGGLSVLFGYKARIGAWLLILFLAPVTVTMHRFWGMSDPAAALQQQIHFMKNLALLGGAMMIAYFGPGPLSAKG